MNQSTLEPLLVEDSASGDLKFTGDLYAGKRVAQDERYVREGRAEAGYFFVHTYDRESDAEEGNESWAEWGHSMVSLDEAWRFVLGAMFGPVDDEYDEAALRKVLNNNTP